MDEKYFRILILYLIFISEVKSNLLESMENLQKDFDNFVVQTFSVIKESVIQDKYSEIYNNGGFEILPVNPLEIAKEFSIQLAEEFSKKMESLKRAVDFAEKEATEYTWDPEIKPENVSYIDSKKLNENDPRLGEHQLFKVKVISNQSSVHIPTEIFEEDEKILNTIKWTSYLHDIFKENINLRYQYFASVNGIVVQYPGMKWRKNETDMFDVRRRQWYVQGASSPKDVMILIDTSGSMHGIAIKLTIQAVQKLIDTMGENDYIAVGQFPGSEKKIVKPHLLVDNPLTSRIKCFETFVQANKRNKNRLFRQINQLRAKGIAHLDEALEFAIEEYQKFDNFSKNGNEGANCNRLIIVFTDSGDQYDREKIKFLINRSNTTKNIKIFIYYVGQEISPTYISVNQTCDYRGYFGHILSMGAVSNIIDKYSRVIHNHKIHCENLLDTPEFRVNLAPIQEDGFHNPDDFPPLGLGLMTSLTMPVYNRSGNGSFLGLMGTDMTVAFMDDLVPHDKLGPNGYAFAINTNGYIIFHPELKNQLGWMRDPPNVDLSEIEFSSENKIQVRSKIINCASSNGTESGEDDVIGLIKVPDEIHTYEDVRTYAYHGVPLSTFGITIVNSKYNKFYPKFSSEITLNKLIKCSHILCSININLPASISVDLHFSNDVFLYVELGLMKRCKLLEDNTNTFPVTSTTSATTYHSTPVKSEKTAAHLIPISTTGSTMSNAFPMLQNINMSNFIKNYSRTNESVTMVYQIPKFSHQLLKILDFLQNQSNNKCPDYESRRLIVDLFMMDGIAKYLSESQSITSVIVTTLTGLSMVYPKSERHAYKDLFDNAMNSAIFQRTFDMKKIIFYTPFNRQSLSKDSQSHKDTSRILMFKSLSVTVIRDRTIPVAVLGLTWNQSKIINFLQKYDVCNISRLCYLIEDGGYIISTNNPLLSYQVGYFFGDVHYMIMSSLINNSIFKRTEDYDYQAICPKQKEEEEVTSAGDKLKPFKDLLSIPILIMKSVIHFIENLYLFMKLFLFLHFQPSYAQEATAADNKNVSCIKKYYRYFLTTEINDNKPIETVVTCENCTFPVLVQRMINSNIILVSFDNSCTNHCDNFKHQSIPRYPVKDPGPNICELSNKPRYRLRPKYKCYAFDPNEDFTICRSSKITFISLKYLLIFIFISKVL